MLLNKPHLFNLTQRRFYFNSIILHVLYIFGLYLGHPRLCQYERYKGSCVKSPKVSLLIDTTFIMLKHKICNIKVYDHYSFKKFIRKDIY